MHRHTSPCGLRGLYGGVKDRITALGGDALPLTPQEFGAKASDDSKRFGALIKEKKIIGD